MEIMTGCYIGVWWPVLCATARPLIGDVTERQFFRTGNAAWCILLLCMVKFELCYRQGRAEGSGSIPYGKVGAAVLPYIPVKSENYENENTHKVPMIRYANQQKPAV